MRGTRVFATIQADNFGAGAWQANRQGGFGGILTLTYGFKVAGQYFSPVLRVRHASAFSIQLSWRAAAGAGSLCGKEEEEIRSLLQGLPEVRHVEAKSGDADLDHEEAHVGGHHGEVRLSSHFRSQDFGI